MIRPFPIHVASFTRLILAALLLAVFLHPSALASDPEKTLSDVLSSAESLFKSMRERDDAAVWRKLSAASRRTIVEETRREIEKSEEGKAVSEEAIRRDFEEGGPVASAYWEGFLTNFDPGIVLEQSRWEIGKIAGDRAEIILIHKTSEKPALLKLFREDGSWKTGLVETFWGRR